jgi:hypothetical protein
MARSPEHIDHDSSSFDAHAPLRIQDAPGFPERRRWRRHELLGPQVIVERWDSARSQAVPLGEIVDLSAGGVRIRTGDPTIAPGEVIQIRLSLPSHAGICPFVSYAGMALQPSCEWVGRLAVQRRLERDDGTIDLGGRLLGMDESTRGMLGLYLSIQPLAA